MTQEQTDGHTKGLIERLEAAEVGSRELDGEIAVLVGGFWTEPGRYEGARPMFCKLDPDGREVRPGHGGDQMVPAYTTSLDAALSLAERVLPGWFVGLQQNRYELVSGPQWSAYLSPPERCNEDIERDAPTAPLALCAAILRAKEQAS